MCRVCAFSVIEPSPSEKKTEAWFPPIGVRLAFNLDPLGSLAGDSQLYQGCRLCEPVSSGRLKQPQTLNFVCMAMLNQYVSRLCSPRGWTVVI